MRRLTLVLFALYFFIGQVYGQGRVVCDETCEIGAETKSAATKGNAGYAVVSPVGRGTVEPINQAQRLNTLSGKTIAVVGVSFMSRVTHPEIKRLIEKNYPDAHVLLLDEVGTAGPYPAPGITRRAKDEFQQRLRDLNVDAVISGNGGCGLCTPKETGSCIAAEYIGIPSVIITAPSFTAQARYTALNNGMPVLRVVEYPNAFALDDEATLIKNTQEILWPQIVDALTKPITNEERNKDLAANHGYLRRTEGAETTPTPEWYDSPEDYIETVPTMQQGMTKFLITGENSRNKLQTMTGGGYSTIKIELPHNWDSLMKELGYSPIGQFYIK